MKKILLLVLWLAPVIVDADIASLLVPIEDLETAATKAPARARATNTEEQPQEAPQPVQVRSEDVLPILAGALLRHYGADGELRLTLLQEWQGVTVANEAWDVELLRLPQNGLTQRMVLPVRITCGDTAVEHQLVVNCRLFREVLAPVRKINRGEPLVRENFEILTRDVLTSAAPIVAASEELENYESKQPLLPGKILLWRDLEEKPLVRRGQIVEVVAEEGLLRISVKGEALEDGKAGDYISVRNTTTRKNLQARILDEQSVQVLF